jgi:hypothetical protein
VDHFSSGGWYVIVRACKNFSFVYSSFIDFSLIAYILLGTQALATCLVPKDRLEVIHQARISFQHDVQAVHNEEMARGADSALTKHLTYLLYHFCLADSERQREPSQKNLRLELSLTCDALESLYRASSEAVALSFQRLGLELCHLLVALLNRELKLRQQLMTTNDRNRNDASFEPCEPQSTPRLHEEERYGTLDAMDEENEIITDEGDLLLRQATKILGHFARVGEAIDPMAHHPGLLQSLIFLISLRPYDLVPWEARLSALWILANLACDVKNMPMMASTAGLVQSLVDVAKRPFTSADSLEMIIECLRSRSIASRAILNLSWAADNKILLAENNSLIQLLAELCVFRSVPYEIGLTRNSTTIQTILDKTRRHAVGALRNIAAAPRKTKIELCHSRNGHLLDVLTDAALNDPDTHVKDRALATIHNLAVYDTATMMVNHPALVLALKDVLSSNDLNASGCGDTGKNRDQETGDAHHQGDGTPRQHASATLLVLERAITPEMSCYENLRDLLDALKTAPNSTMTAV